MLRPGSIICFVSFSLLSFGRLCNFLLKAWILNHISYHRNSYYAIRNFVNLIKNESLMLLISMWLEMMGFSRVFFIYSIDVDFL